jgi:hypothetical protein
MKLKVKDLEEKMLADDNLDGWAFFHRKNGEVFKYRGGWRTQSGVHWTEVVHVLDPYEKGKEPRHSTFLLQKRASKSVLASHIYLYKEL